MLKNTRFALGMRQDLGVGVKDLELDQLFLRKHLVNYANARPQDQIATCLFDKVATQILVWCKNDRPIWRNLVDDLFCIAGRADDIAHRLDLGGAIDVADNDVARIFLFETPEQMGWAAICQ